jgi:hypothetical protein
MRHPDAKAHSRPAQRSRNARVDVLVVGAERGVESPDRAEGVRSVEGARPAGAEDAVGGMSLPIERRLPVASLARPAEQGIAVSGRVDPRRVGSDQHQGGDRPDARVGERLQAPFDPAGGHLGVIVQELDDFAPGLGDARVCRPAEAQVAIQTHQLDVGMGVHDPIRRAVG